MRLADWLRDKSLIKAARELAEKNSTFKQMLEVLECEHPLTAPMEQRGPSADDRSYRLGRIEGYAECLRTLRKLWSPTKKMPRELTATFEPPE